MAQTLFALMIVIAMIVALKLIAGHFGLANRVGGAQRLQVLDQCVVSTRQRICIVKANERRFLIGVSEANISLLDRLPDETEDAQTKKPGCPIGSDVLDSQKTASAPKDSVRWLAPAAFKSLRIRSLTKAFLFGCLCILVLPFEAIAQTEDPALITLGLSGAGAPDEISSTLEIVALLTIVSVAPSILLMTTCFTRIIIVLGFLRQAIGVQQLPPSQVLIGLSFFITLFVMAPVVEEIRANAYVPYVAEEIDAETATTRAMAPMRTFMASHTRETDLELFLELSGQGPVEDISEIPITNLLPAFMLSELRTAFEIGFMIYLPFLVVDLIVASLLISMGMIVLPPIIISLPFKLMLFVLMDGWNRVVGSLVDGLI